MKFPLRWRKLREKFNGNRTVILSLLEFPKNETVEREHRRDIQCILCFGPMLHKY